jgi:hypothetical protein
MVFHSLSWSITAVKLRREATPPELLPWIALALIKKTDNYSNYLEIYNKIRCLSIKYFPKDDRVAP